MKKIALLLAFLAAGCGNNFATTTMQDMQNEQEKQIAKYGEEQLERMGFVGGKAILTKSGQVVQSTMGYNDTDLLRHKAPHASRFMLVCGACFYIPDPGGTQDKGLL